MSKKFNSSRNTILELLRFVFASYVIFFHLDKDVLGPDSVIVSLWKADITFFRNGFIGVEFFFILTGLFMAEKVYKLNELEGPKKIGEETIDYIFRKAKAVWPVFAVVAVIKVVLHILGGVVPSGSSLIFRLYFSFRGRDYAPGHMYMNPGISVPC